VLEATEAFFVEYGWALKLAGTILAATVALLKIRQWTGAAAADVISSAMIKNIATNGVVKNSMGAVVRKEMDARCTVEHTQTFNAINVMNEKVGGVWASVELLNLGVSEFRDRVNVLDTRLPVINGEFKRLRVSINLLCDTVEKLEKRVGVIENAEI